MKLVENVYAVLTDNFHFMVGSKRLAEITSLLMSAYGAKAVIRLPKK